MKTNAQIIADFVKEMQQGEKDLALNLDWFYWVMDYLSNAEFNNVKVNPEYLRADYHMLNDTEPLTIFYKL